MDEKLLSQGNSLVAKIKRLKELKSKVTWYKNNETTNKTTIVCFGTCNTSSICKDSYFDDSVFPIMEIIDEYSGRLDKKINELEKELENL